MCTAGVLRVLGLFLISALFKASALEEPVKVHLISTYFKSVSDVSLRHQYLESRVDH